MFYLQGDAGLTWLKGQGDVARGTNSGCDAALRPCGSARVACAGGAQGAPSGREARRPLGRPCGAPRVGSVIEGIQTISRGSHSPIYTHHFPFFSPCGTMFPHGLTCAGRVAAQQASDPVGPHRKASIAWTRVHTVVRSSTWGKSRLSGYDRMLTCGHVESPGASDLHHADGSESRGPRRSCGSRSPGSPSDGPQLSQSPPIVATRGPLQSVGFPSNGGGTS